MEEKIEEILTDNIEKSIERDNETFYDGENSFAGISKKIK